MASPAAFLTTDQPEPHLKRARQILASHPEVKSLFGNTPSTFIYTALIVALQIGLAVALRGQPWWVILLAAYTVGATCNHAMFVVMHDATHNLIFKGTLANRWAGVFANIPVTFPGAAMGFRKFHLLHHRYQGEFARDADLAGPIEARIVGKSAIMKSLWLLFFFVIEGFVRPARLKTVKLWDRWAVVNLVTEVAFLVALTMTFGWTALAYLALSSVFSIGLHPFGARWIQEHYLIKPDQETYSYYGPLNKVMFNVGYHNEHHDLMMVPWSRLPKLKAMAPEFYDNLYSHQSYTGLLLKFIFSPDLNLYSRMTRTPRPTPRSGAVAAQTSAEGAMSGAHAGA